METHTMTDQPDQTIDLDLRTGQYVALRDLIKEKEAGHKLELKPIKATLETLANVIMGALDKVGVESVRTNSGTAYLSAKNSASLADADAFMKHVIETNAWDLLDRKANSTAVADYIAEHGTVPPGVNYSVTRVLGVRRA